VDDSIIVVRSAIDTVKAYHNVCPHRGRALTEGCGHVANQFVCRFHGWRFDLQGRNIEVVDRADWGGRLADEDIGLSEVRVGVWAGFVWINMDPSAEPLEQFLAPVIERTRLHRFEELRFRWYKTVRIDANWKVAATAFDEGYHVAQTHPELMAFMEYRSRARAFGPHGAFMSEAKEDENAYAVQPSARRGGPPPNADYRDYVLGYVQDMHEELRAMVTKRNFDAAQRLRVEVAADAPQGEVLEKWVRFQVEAATADGAGWPEGMTPDYVRESQGDWHVFPNTVFLHGQVDGVLWYRMRPDGHNPDSSLLDIWSLERFAPGAAPELVREYYDDWTDTEWGRILPQDFRNMPKVQKGMKSRGFRGCRINPHQELVISNFHRALREHIARGRGPAGA
jgi:phenylpropionate dioxygenase-like ring-hydroxylating dioxygenase large terminal subunit